MHVNTYNVENQFKLDMKKIGFPLFLSLVLLAAGCNKDEDPIIEEPGIGEQEVGATDEAARDEYWSAMDDAFNAMNGTSLQTGKSKSGSGLVLPCGAFRIDSTAGKRFTIRYNGTTNCGARVLSGSISVGMTQQGVLWRDPGAEMEITFSNYEVKFLANNEVLIFNGSLYVTNATGGLLRDLLSQSPIEHKIRGNLDITFDNGATRTWSIHRKRTFSSDDGTWSGVKLLLAADSTGNVSEVGINRHGNAFVTTIPNPFLYENCTTSNSLTGPYVLVFGKMVSTVGNNYVSAEGGFVLTNGQATYAGDCSSSAYLIKYHINGHTTQLIQPY